MEYNFTDDAIPDEPPNVTKRS